MKQSIGFLFTGVCSLECTHVTIEPDDIQKQAAPSVALSRTAALGVCPGHVVLSLFLRLLQYWLSCVLPGDLTLSA